MSYEHGRELKSVFSDITSSPIEHSNKGVV